MSDEQQDDLAQIEAIAWRVLRLAYIRPALRGTQTLAFELTEEEINTMLDGFEPSLMADMDILSECLRAARTIGAHSGEPQPMDDTITLRGNDDE